MPALEVCGSGANLRSVQAANFNSRYEATSALILGIIHLECA
jgi:hypothetical protein